MRRFFSPIVEEPRALGASLVSAIDAILLPSISSRSIFLGTVPWLSNEVFNESEFEDLKEDVDEENSGRG